MVHPSSTVKFVNTDARGDAGVVTVDELFYKFIARSSNNIITFDDTLVYLSNFSGYVRLKTIEKINTTELAWVGINHETYGLLVSMGSMIAIYESKDRGFHGVENLKYHMKPTGSCLNHSDDNIIVFDHINKDICIVPLVARLVTDDIGYGYKIVTGSGIVDVNGICIDARKDKMLYV